MDDLEPGIRPLVEALNATGIVRTFSSCEGHFRPDEQTVVDRNRADVRFIPATDNGSADVEKLIGLVLTRFKRQHGLIPVIVSGYKLYTAIDDELVDETFVLELRPFNRFDPPDRKRADIDRAVKQAATIVAGLRLAGN